MNNWKRNFIFIWFSQFLSIMGFAFAMPFAPFYIQDLGVTDPDHLKLWVALFAAATPMGLAIFSPVWGVLSDYFGRRIMLLRANFAAGIVLVLMGFARNVETLALLRFVQGALTGTVTAAQTMVAVHTPVNRSGLALGALSSALFSGGMMGAFFGGVFADTFGYRMTFWLSGLFPLLAFLLVLLGTREDFHRPVDEEGMVKAFPRPHLPQLGAAGPILFLIVAVASVRQFDMAFVPLLVQEIHGGIEGVARWTGLLFALVSIAGLLGGFILGNLADRWAPPRIARFSALGAGLMMIPQGLAQGFALLFLGRFGMIFCAGGLDPVFQIWLAKTTSEHRRGLIFGWASTAKSVGWIIAPLLGGLVATVFDIRMIYGVNAVLFLLLIPLIGYVVKRMQQP